MAIIEVFETSDERKAMTVNAAWSEEVNRER
jgi:hypothetical protein